MTGLGDRHVKKQLHEWTEIAQVLREQDYHDVAQLVEESVRDAMRDHKNSKIIVLNEDQDLLVREAGYVAQGLKRGMRTPA